MRRPAPDPRVRAWPLRAAVLAHAGDDRGHHLADGAGLRRDACPPPAARPRQSPAEFRAGKADVAGADRAPGLGVDLGEAGQVTEFVELGGGDVAGGVLRDEDGVEDPDYLLVDPGRRVRERFRCSRSHPGTRRDIQRSNSHGVASFGQRYKSSGSRGDDEFTNTKKHHGATSWCHLLPCWAHEKTSFILVPAEVPKSLSLLKQSLRHGTGRGASGLQRQAREPAADPALCGGWR